MNEEAEPKEEPTAEVPMMHLASFALHKLFSEWQAEGFEIPDFKTGGPAIATELLDAETVPIAPPPPVIKTTVPENANTMHPTTLLCMVSVDAISILTDELTCSGHLISISLFHLRLPDATRHQIC